MPDVQEIAAKFWKALKSDRTAMLGLTDGEAGHARPMTVLFEGDRGGPCWVFTSSDNDLVEALAGGSGPANLQFASKGHDVFASLEGLLTVDTDRGVVERLWNPFVAAWYEGGKDDPKLRLLRFDPQHAQVWLDENSLFAGVKMLLGHDPKKDYADKVAEIPVASAP